MAFTLSPVLYLVLAHLVGDYVMQTDFLAKMKGQNNFILFIHCLLWTLVCCVMLDVLHLFAWWHFPWLLLSHMAMDWIKCHKMPAKDGLGWCLWVDQAFHIFSLVVCLI